MKWTKLMIKTTSEAEDIIISTMYDLGLEGAQIEDKVPLTAWERSRCSLIFCRMDQQMTVWHT